MQKVINSNGDILWIHSYVRINNNESIGIIENIYWNGIAWICSVNIRGQSCKFHYNEVYPVDLDLGI